MPNSDPFEVADDSLRILAEGNPEKVSELIEEEKAIAEVSEALGLPVLTQKEINDGMKSLAEANLPNIKAALEMGPLPGDLGCD